jgi:hypothetical protein
VEDGRVWWGGCRKRVLLLEEEAMTNARASTCVCLVGWRGEVK